MVSKSDKDEFNADVTQAYESLLVTLKRFVGKINRLDFKTVEERAISLKGYAQLLRDTQNEYEGIEQDTLDDD